MISPNIQLKMKIDLERLFRPEVRKVFNSIKKDMRITIAVTGMPPNIDNYKRVWEGVLLNHYKRVQRRFKGAVKPGKQTAEDDLLELALKAWREGQTITQAAIINETTKKNMREAIRLARQRAIEEGVQLTEQELAYSSTGIFAKKFSGRESGIIITETQTAAESAKYAEAEVYSGIKPAILGGQPTENSTTKRWLTVGDKRVRPIHRLANGQIKPLQEPYVVNNQFLMYPGDSYYGATPDNIANCRCISVYRFIPLNS